MRAVLHTGGEREREDAAVEMALARQLDAVILGTSWTRPVSVPHNLAQLPTVLWDCYVPGSVFTSVLPDDYRGGLAATALLIEAGHRRIGFVNGVGSTYAAQERERRFADALAGAGLPYDPSLVRHGSYESNSGHLYAAELLDLPDPPTALFARPTGWRSAPISPFLSADCQSRMTSQSSATTIRSDWQSSCPHRSPPYNSRTSRWERNAPSWFWTATTATARCTR